MDFGYKKRRRPGRNFLIGTMLALITFVVVPLTRDVGAKESIVLKLASFIPKTDPDETAGLKPSEKVFSTRLSQPNPIMVAIDYLLTEEEFEDLR